MNSNEIKALIEQGLPGARVLMSGEGCHQEATVISGAFEGLMTIKRHRMVYAALGNKMGNEIHALVLKTLTPNELGE
jgi:acid stress-induced BolA-like protein IbaG/YrbA